MKNTITLKRYSSGNRREGFYAMNVKVIVLPKRDFNFKLKLESNDDG